MGPAVNMAMSTFTPMMNSTLTPMAKPRRALSDVNPNSTATTPGKVKTVFRGSCSLTLTQPIPKSFVGPVSQPVAATKTRSIVVEKEPPHEIEEPSPSVVDAQTTIGGDEVTSPLNDVEVQEAAVDATRIADNDDDMPQWLRSAESILQGNEAETLSPGISEETAARVALSWLGAGSGGPKGATLLDAEVRCMQDRRHAAVAEQRALKAEVAALQAAQAHLEAKGEAYASEREAACRIEALEEAAEAERVAFVEREAANEARSSKLRAELSAATLERDEAEAARLEAVRAAELCAAELKATERAISRLDASKRAAERERDAALLELRTERDLHAGQRGEAEAEAARLRQLLVQSAEAEAEAVLGRSEAADAANELEAELIATREQRDLLAQRVLVQSAAVAEAEAASAAAAAVQAGAKAATALATTTTAAAAATTTTVDDAARKKKQKKQKKKPLPQQKPQQKKPTRGYFVAVAVADGFSWEWRSR